MSQESKSTRKDRGRDTTSPSKRTISNVAVNRQESPSVEGSPSLRTVVHDSKSVRSRYETRPRKARGLTVSFVTKENLQLQQPSDCSSHRDGLHKRKCGDLSFAEEREKGESLTSSLNNSRFGALERHRMWSCVVHVYTYVKGIYTNVKSFLCTCTEWVLWVQIPPKAALKNDCFGQVVLCCFVFLWCCVALPCHSKHLWMIKDIMCSIYMHMYMYVSLCTIVEWCYMYILSVHVQCTCIHVPVGQSDQPCKMTRRVGHQRWAGDDPRLGYDWIAGLVEAGSALENKDEEYFVEMREFRRVNHSECSRPHPLL